MGCTKEKKVTQEGIGSLKFEELRDIDVSYAVPKWVHMLAFTESKWVAFADPVQQTGWLIDIKITSLYVMTGTQHKVWKVVKGGCALISLRQRTSPLPKGIR